MERTERKFKADDELRIVWGEVYIPNVPDTDGEFMDAVAIREMAYKFMKNMRLRNVDTRHNNQVVNDVCVVESFIARKGDPDFIEGAWVLGTHIPDEKTWKAIKAGELNGYSMESMVNKIPVDLEIEVQPIISGLTQKAAAPGAGDDHEHEFHVSYNPEGDFLGGRTNVVNSHYHVIKRGTVTEEAAGHRHRFAHMDLLVQGEPKVLKEDISHADLAVAGKKAPQQSRRLKKRRGLAQHLRY